MILYYVLELDLLKRVVASSITLGMVEMLSTSWYLSRCLFSRIRRSTALATARLCFVSPWHSGCATHLHVHGSTWVRLPPATLYGCFEK